MKDLNSCYVIAFEIQIYVTKAYYSQSAFFFAATDEPFLINHQGFAPVLTLKELGELNGR
jgi:hypothetical protein